MRKKVCVLVSLRVCLCMPECECDIYFCLSLVYGYCIAGTISNVYSRQRLSEIRSLRDQMMTSSGALALHVQMASPSYQRQLTREKDIALDPIKSHQRLQVESRQTKERVNLDSAKELLQTTGFLEKIGADQIFMSDTSNYFQCPAPYHDEV